MRNPYGNIAAPPHGYIWDFAKRAERDRPQLRRVRRAGQRSGGKVGARRCPASTGTSIRRIRRSIWRFRTTTRVDIWLKEFTQFEQDGDAAARCRSSGCGNDHTNGTAPGSPTPRAMVADNDVALGRIVEAISHSRYWKESAIFVLEDDAQNGPDHVDAHRSVAARRQPVLAPAASSTARSTRRRACCARWS